MCLTYRPRVDQAKVTGDEYGGICYFPAGATAAEVGPSRRSPCTAQAVLPPGNYLIKIGLASGKLSYTLSITHH